jgi:hypothetical protein
MTAHRTHRSTCLDRHPAQPSADRRNCASAPYKRQAFADLPRIRVFPIDRARGDRAAVGVLTIGHAAYAAARNVLVQSVSRDDAADVRFAFLVEAALIVFRSIDPEQADGRVVAMSA